MSKNDDLRSRYLAVKQRPSQRRWPWSRAWQGRQLWRLRPIDGGKSAGLSTIRYYWADFLEQHRADIHGHVLEIGETTTVRLYGGDRITQADALDLAPHSPEVRVVADLSRADHVPGDVYDCFVNQFTTCVIYDIEAALYHAIRLLKPGGVLLINFWCVDFYLHRGLDMGTGEPLYMHHWFTPIGVHDLLRRLTLDEQDYTLAIYGNLLSRMAFLVNLPAVTLTPAELAHQDSGQPLLICARIVKPHGWNPPPPAYRNAQWTPPIPPAQLHPDTGHYGDEYQ